MLFSWIYQLYTSLLFCTFYLVLLSKACLHSTVQPSQLTLWSSFPPVSLFSSFPCLAVALNWTLTDHCKSTGWLEWHLFWQVSPICQVQGAFVRSFQIALNKYSAPCKILEFFRIGIGRRPTEAAIYFRTRQLQCNLRSVLDCFLKIYYMY